MTKDIKFSVTIPAFKDKYLKETIDSVLAQTYQNYEVVIVNDASPYNLDNINTATHVSAILKTKRIAVPRTL